jgi:hypothetical protein
MLTIPRIKLNNLTPTYFRRLNKSMPVCKKVQIDWRLVIMSALPSIARIPPKVPRIKLENAYTKVCCIFLQLKRCTTSWKIRRRKIKLGKDNC